MYPSFEQYIQTLFEQMRWQTDKLNALEQTVLVLRAEIDVLKNQKKIHIDKVEYKFDQLKVEKLEGTLNIGISPGSIEDLDLQDDDPGEPDAMMQPELYRQISEHIQLKLQEEVPLEIHEVERKNSFSLDRIHRKLVEDDVTKQLDPRIRHYLEQAMPTVTTENSAAVRDSIYQKVKQDIQSAVMNYFGKFSNEGE